MYTTQQIDFIKAFGDKELTEGCSVEFRDKDWAWNFDIVTIVSNNQFATRWHSIWSKKIDVQRIWHHVEWHHVLSKLKENGYYSEIDTEFCQLTIYKYDSFKEKEIIAFYDCNPCLSPMEQPLLIEELLKLK